MTHTTGRAELAELEASLQAGETPIIGHLVLYSVYDAPVTHDELELWFTELGLDQAYLPAAIRESDAFERVTGKVGIRASYKLATEQPAPPTDPDAEAEEEKVIAATLMTRHVSRDNQRIVRHLVREVRNEIDSELSYDTKLAELLFVRDTSKTAHPGAGSIRINPDYTAIGALADEEQAQVHKTLAEIKAAYEEHCRFYTSDRLRKILRDYIEALNAVSVRTSGGVYFVHRQHEATLAGLRELVARFGNNSKITRIPLPDQDEMRDMVVTAFTTQTREELEKLAMDIATARREGASDTKIEGLHARFRALQNAAREHSTLLETTLEDTTTALQLVNAQIASLLTQT